MNTKSRTFLSCFLYCESCGDEDEELLNLLIQDAFLSLCNKVSFETSYTPSTRSSPDRLLKADLSVFKTRSISDSADSLDDEALPTDEDEAKG